MPTVGAKIESGILSTNTTIKGLPVEYREQGGQWQVYREPVKVKGQVEVRAGTLDRQRAGRTMKVTQQ